MFELELWPAAPQRLEISANMVSMRRILPVFLGLLAFWVISTPARAAGASDLDAVIDQSRRGNEDFLPAEKAFQLTVTREAADNVTLHWLIAPGYYLYRDRIKIADDSRQVGAIQFPEGQIKQDEYFGRQVIYHAELVAHAPVASPAATLSLRVTYQGCAEAGLCYPPITVPVTLAGGGTGSATAPAPAAGPPTGTAQPPGAAAAGYVSEQDALTGLLRNGSLAAVLLEFFVGGLLLAFTPCVLPMVPILSGIIVGHGTHVRTSRAFLLSLTYVLGMSVTYTLTGMAFAAAGKQVQAAFQQPWIVTLFAAVFVAMALSMFGLFTIQMPTFIQSRVAAASNRQRAGHFGGVAIMGALSSLIVTTCVGPVLVAALIFIGQTGDMLRGGAALFSMSLGMGAPLIVVGSSAGRWLPRAGAWMDGIKRLFGALMLGLAAWMLARILPERISLVLWAVPAIAAAVVLWSFRAGSWVPRAAALLVAAYGALLLVGSARGATDPLHPLLVARQDSLPFRSVASVADLRREVEAAAAAHQPVMLDVDADWCVSCKEMQRYTFSDPQVRQALQSVRLLRANVTANNADDQALLQEIRVIGPPTIAFYDSQGREQQRYRVVGFMPAGRFAALLHQALSTG